MHSRIHEPAAHRARQGPRAPGHMLQAPGDSPFLGKYFSIGGHIIYKKDISRAGAEDLPPLEVCYRTDGIRAVKKNIFIMSEFLSRIAIGKSVVKEYRTRLGERTVYLSDGDEFQIQLFNPHPFTIGLEISVNGAGLGGKVVLRPGERVWLDRFLNDVRKLKFETYGIGKGAAAKSAASINGLVTVSAFRESEDGDIIDISWNYGQNCPPSVNATKYNYDPWPVTCAFSNQTAFRQIGRAHV